MKRILFSLSLLFLYVGGMRAQTFVAPNLERYAIQALIDGIKNYGDVIANVSIVQFRGEVKDIPDGDSEAIPARDCFAAAFFPYQCPCFTIGLCVNKHDKPAGRIIASRIVGHIIDFMVKHYLNLQKVDEPLSVAPPKYHPAER